MPHAYPPHHAAARLIYEQGWHRGVVIGGWDGKAVEHFLCEVPAVELLVIEQWKATGAYTKQDMAQLEGMYRRRTIGYHNRSAVLRLPFDEAIKRVQRGLYDFVYFDAESENAEHYVLSLRGRLTANGGFLGHYVTESSSRRLAERLKAKFEFQRDGELWMWLP